MTVLYVRLLIRLFYRLTAVVAPRREQKEKRSCCAMVRLSAMVRVAWCLCRPGGYQGRYQGRGTRGWGGSNEPLSSTVKQTFASRKTNLKDTEISRGGAAGRINPPVQDSQQGSLVYRRKHLRQPTFVRTLPNFFVV